MSSSNPTSVTKLGAGRFGVVYQIVSLPHIAFKVPILSSDDRILELEFESMRTVYASSLCSPSLFQIPTPIAFYNPTTDKWIREDLLGHSSSDDNRRRRRNSLTIDRTTIDCLPSNNACYIMDRIPPLPGATSQFLIEQYGPLNYQGPPLNLCRIYLGRTEKRWAKRGFFNHQNFILDRTGYEATQSASTSFNLPSLQLVAFHMGLTVANIHMTGMDARDVEFVLGGEDTPNHDALDQHAFYTLDFNQMRDISCVGDAAECAEICADAFFLNDPYFPRPRKGEVLYEAFREGYWVQVGRDAESGYGHGHGRRWVELKNAFFGVLEARQAEKDARSGAG